MLVSTPIAATVPSTENLPVTQAEAAVTPQEALWRAWMLRRDAALRERLLLQYAPLVKYVIGRTAITPSATLDAEDLLASGTVGLLDAIDRYDPERGVSFESYAIPRIRGAIIDSVRALDPLSRTTRRRGRQIEDAYVTLETELGRPANEQEVADYLAIDLATVRETQLQTSATVVSLESPVDADDSAASSLADLIPDADSPNPAQLVESRDMLRCLAGALQILPERERLVLALYYNEELKMKEVASILEVSESRVCQLHAQALARLRRHLAGQGLN